MPRVPYFLQQNKKLVTKYGSVNTQNRKANIDIILCNGSHNVK